MPHNIESGMGFPEGATWDANRGGTNFAMFARNATRVELCLFDAPDATEIQRLDLPERFEHV
jgi:isoamylase